MSRIINFIYLFKVKYHSEHVKQFIDSHGSEYLSIKQIKPEDETSEWTARDLSM